MLLFFFFWQEVGLVGEHDQWGAGADHIMSTGPAICSGNHDKDVLDPTANWDEWLFCHHVFKFILIKLSKSPLLRDVHHWLLGNLNLALLEGLNHMPLVLRLGVDWHYDLVNVDPGHCALGLSKGMVNTCLEPRLGTAGQSRMPTRKSCL